MAYVHMQSCVHRDLKLENILLDRHENVKLVDFGFTREYEGRTNHLQTFCGTICYAAPEMLRGEKYAGEKIDVWSLGIILYALLCGELPYDDDDDNVTRTRILSEEPTYPEHLPAEAVALLKLMLSKRPFPRPCLQDILAHPFLAEHAPAQQTILQIQAQPPFSTALEKDCLLRMRSAGVDIDAIIESVLAQKCDALSGWWKLLLEKESRKMHRREKKRKEKELERSLRRLSAASSRLERMAPTLQDVDEDGGLTSQFIRLGESSGSRSRGRSERRSAHYYGDFAFTDLPQLPEANRESGGSLNDDMPRPLLIRTRSAPFPRLATVDRFRRQRRASYEVRDLAVRRCTWSPRRTPLLRTTQATLRMRRPLRKPMASRRPRKSQAKPSLRTGRTGHIGSLRTRRDGATDTRGARVAVRPTCTSRHPAITAARTPARGRRRASIRLQALLGPKPRRRCPKESSPTAMPPKDTVPPREATLLTTAIHRARRLCRLQCICSGRALPRRIRTRDSRCRPRP